MVEPERPRIANPNCVWWFQVTQEISWWIFMNFPMFIYSPGLEQVGTWTHIYIYIWIYDQIWPERTSRHVDIFSERPPRSPSRAFGSTLISVSPRKSSRDGGTLRIFFCWTSKGRKDWWTFILKIHLKIQFRYCVFYVTFIPFGESSTWMYWMALIYLAKCYQHKP